MQVETETNMRSQVAGVRRSSDEVDPGHKNKKRIKLAHRSEENSSDPNEMLESTNMETFGHSENIRKFSDNSEVQENGQYSNIQENRQFTNLQENEQFTYLQENGQLFNGQENGQSDSLHFNGTGVIHELNNMENLNNDIVNGNNSFQNENEGEPVSMNTESEYPPPPTLKIQYNDTYQYASSTIEDVRETEPPLIRCEESSETNCVIYSKDEMTYISTNDSGETILYNVPKTAQLSNSDTILYDPERQLSNSETILYNVTGITQLPNIETISAPEKAPSSDSNIVLGNDSDMEHLSNSDTILLNAPEVLQPSCSETVSKNSPYVTKLSSHETLQSPSCSYEINASKNDEQSMSIVSQDDVKYLGIYDLKTTQLDGHADVIFSVAADDKIVLSSSGDTTIKMWDVENQKEVCTFSGHSDAVTGILLLSHNQSKEFCEKLKLPTVSSIVISASMDCHIKVWSVSDVKELSSVYTYNGITCIGYLQSESYVVIGTEGGKLEIWNLLEKKIVESTFAHESSVSGLEVHDNYVFSISMDGAVKVWLFEDGELLPLYCRRRRETSKNGADIGPTQWKSIAVNGDNLFLGDNTPYLKTLNWRIGRLKLLVNQLGKNGECDAVLAKENILLSSSYDSSTDTAAVNVWSLPDMMYIGTLTGDVQDIYCLALTQFENKLRIVSGGHQLTVWDFNLKDPPKENSNASFSFCELDGLGTEAYDKPKEHTIPISVSPSKFKEANQENQGRCVIL